MGILSTISLMIYVSCASAKMKGAHYAFYRDMRPIGESAGIPAETRRVFGGTAAPLSTFPAACVLLDRYWITRCSGAVIAPHWALTAAHCINSHLSYIRYNTRHPSQSEGDVSAVIYLYRHPRFKVVQEDQGSGMDVTVLHHDVGLVRVRNAMKLSAGLAQDPLRAMLRHAPDELYDQEVQVLGFGRTERSVIGEELSVVTLRVIPCGRSAWVGTACGVAEGRAPGRSARGVCAGDSGGPVVVRDAQVGVTSMGPVVCKSETASAEGTTSVFMALHSYVPMVNATITDADSSLRMTALSQGTLVCAHMSWTMFMTLTGLLRYCIVLFL